jgi:hypothetical protein
MTTHSFSRLSRFWYHTIQNIEMKINTILPKSKYPWVNKCWITTLYQAT